MLVQDAGRDQGHDGDEGFGQHAAVTDDACLALLLQQLRRGTRGDQRVEARQRAAGDGDEQEREQRTCERRALTVVCELADRRSLHHRSCDDDARREQHDGADLHEGGQVVARREQQPHR